jgi:hypothetical protein
MQDWDLEDSLFKRILALVGELGRSFVAVELELVRST